MKKTLLIIATLFVAVGAWAQDARKGKAGIFSAEQLMAAKEPVNIVIQNISATNRWYFCGNKNLETFETNSEAWFVWEPSGDGETFYLKKLVPTQDQGEGYLQTSAPSAIGDKATAQKFTAVFAAPQNDTTAPTQDSDAENLVRFVKADNPTTWINCQGWNATPVYNSGKGGWTMHNVYAIEDVSTVEFTYKVMYDGAVKYTEKVDAVIGEAFPQLPSLPDFVSTQYPAGEVEASDENKEFELVCEAALPFKTSDSYNNAVWYYMNIRDDSPTYLCYNAAKDYIIANESSYPLTDSDAYIWAFIGNPFDGFQIVNKAAGETKLLSSPNDPTGNKNATELARMVANEDATGNKVWNVKKTTHANAANGAFYIEHPTAAAYALNRQDYDATRALCYWNGRDTGSAIQVVECDFTGSAELQALIDMVKAAQANYVVGTTVGYLTQASVDAVVSALASAEEALKGTMTVEISLQHQAAINAAIAALATVQPEEGKFYTIVSAMPETDTRSGKKIYISNDGGMYFENASTLAHVFQFVPASDGKYYLYGVERGTYLTTSMGHAGGQHKALATDKAQAKAVKIANMGRENVVSITPESGAMIHAQADLSKVVAWNNSESTGASAWKIVEVDMSAVSHPMVITDAGWATLVLGCNVAIPADVKAYVVSATSETSAKLTEITGAIPANESVLLNAAPGTYEFKYVAEAAPVAENLLVGSVLDTNVHSEAYVLSVQGEPAVVGFRMADFKVSTNTENDGEEGAEDDTFEAFKNNAFRAYLPAPVAGARFLSFDFGTETVIDELKGENGNVKTVIYDLSGRSVQKAQKGLYIVNGLMLIM